MRRKVSFALMTALLVALLASVALQVWALPAAANAVVAVFPEVQPIVVPSIIWGVIAIACWQAAAIIGLRITVLARNHKFDASAYGLLRAIIWILVSYVAQAVAAVIALNVLGWATPGVIYGLFVSGLLALVIVGAVVLFLGTRPLARYYTRHRSA